MYLNQINYTILIVVPLTESKDWTTSFSRDSILQLSCVQRFFEESRVSVLINLHCVSCAEVDKFRHYTKPFFMNLNGVIW